MIACMRACAFTTVALLLLRRRRPCSAPAPLTACPPLPPWPAVCACRCCLQVRPGPACRAQPAAVCVHLRTRAVPVLHVLGGHDACGQRVERCARLAARTIHMLFACKHPACGISHTRWCAEPRARRHGRGDRHAAGGGQHRARKVRAGNRLGGRLCPCRLACCSVPCIVAASV